jgi:hypothetical protein
VWVIYKHVQDPNSHLWFHVGNVFTYRKSCGDYMKRLSNGRYLKEHQLGPYLEHYIRVGKSPDDKKTPHFLLIFLQISTIFASFSRAHARTLQNPNISPCTTTVQNNTVESSTIFYSNLMLCINWFY